MNRTFLFQHTDVHPLLNAGPPFPIIKSWDSKVLNYKIFRQNLLHRGSSNINAGGLAKGQTNNNVNTYFIALLVHAQNTVSMRTAGSLGGLVFWLKSQRLGVQFLAMPPWHGLDSVIPSGSTVLRWLLSHGQEGIPKSFKGSEMRLDGRRI